MLAANKLLPDTGAAEIAPPHPVITTPPGRIFSRPTRKALTNNHKEENGTLEAKARLVTPGDVGPDGKRTVEDGGTRTDAPRWRHPYGCTKKRAHNLCLYTCNISSQEAVTPKEFDGTLVRASLDGFLAR